MSTKNSRVIKTLLSALFWIMLWQGLALLIGKPLLFPTPVSVILRLTELVCTIEFWNYTLISLLRISTGISAAMLAGVILAVLTCRFSVLDTLFSPIITIVKTTPVASFVVLVLIWIKRDYVPVLISALMVLPVVWANVSAGIRNTNKQLLEMAQVYKLRTLKKISCIYIPSCRSYFRSACTGALGFGWKAGIAAEVLTVPKVSIGRMIYESKLYLQTTDLFAWTAAVIILSLCLEKIVMRIIAGGPQDA